jgi:hypothetical protein
MDAQVSAKMRAGVALNRAALYLPAVAIAEWAGNTKSASCLRGHHGQSTRAFAFP